ncbi:hypothetical protein [Candidatus Poriferisocius sp.]|uniref:hypothetical protein n=1 Tax=Candidatus Poriferisocius sp. TaxID=3101276 RepID=UPI003B0251ED
MNGDVRVRLPAAPEYSTMARTPATHIARLLGFATGEVSDLSLVMEATMVLLLDPERSGDSITLSYRGKAGIMTIQARINPEPNFPIRPGRIDWFEATVGLRVDSWKLDPDRHRLWLQKTTGCIPQPTSTVATAKTTTSTPAPAKTTTSTAGGTEPARTS